ncbi:MAG: hypothetical protein QME28_02310 [Candidatus Saccharicenans sp.]|nr:hypothetical protein [Candidatus Saccharicenans sp.]
MPEFNLKQLLPLYQEVAILKYGGTLDFDRLERYMEPVRLGQEEFSRRHLEALQLDHLFPAWWKLPELKEDELEAMKSIFKNPGPKNEKVIQKLFDIFKNIEILSCLLRVICPQHYGIYSAPVENLLAIRAETPLKKYLIYLDNLTELQEAYGFKRIADVDMALFALCCLLNEEYLRQNPDYHEIYTNYLQNPNPIKKISARNALQRLRQENISCLELAECFLEIDPEIAGFLAGKELESTVNNLLLEEKGRSGLKKFKLASMPEKLEELVLRKVISDRVKEDMQKWWDTRNDCVHIDWSEASGEELASLKTNVVEMIEGIKLVRERIES